MKWFLCLIAAVMTFSLATSAKAADDPSGTYKWSRTFNNNTVDMTLTLKLEGDKLTGTVAGGRNNTSTAIENGSYKDGDVSFTVTRERNGNKFTSKYSGKLSGDSIKGKIEMEGGNNGSRTVDWEAKKS